ncbi:SLATT domain-containing protein [Photobacterium sp. GSS17]|uniref:SLATT domain-containing protein n=1 Tax=Photobacterium sp. GSS17 TaxID=3020715 RepID=UPI00235FA607|nr:SLATT domain-containing protein [Photobacterium sp. GSS17]
MLSDNIWFTRIARIEASKRLLSLERQCQILLISYSLLSVCLSIIFLVKDSSQFDNVVLCLFSTVILVLSLFITNSDYKGRGVQLKENYIELQNIYFLVKDLESENKENEDPKRLKELRDEYIKLLHQTENHSTADDLRARSKQKTTRPLKENEKQQLDVMDNLSLLRVIFSWLPFVIGTIYGFKALFNI